jgi:hypothetical protein
MFCCCRYNQLLSVVRSSLQELQAVTAGLQVLSAEAEASLNALANHQVRKGRTLQ